MLTQKQVKFQLLKIGFNQQDNGTWTKIIGDTSYRMVLKSRVLRVEKWVVGNTDTPEGRWTRVKSGRYSTISVENGKFIGLS